MSYQATQEKLITDFLKLGVTIWFKALIILSLHTGGRKLYDWSLETIFMGDFFDSPHSSLGLDNTVKAGPTTAARCNQESCKREF